jgi:hypothetical protein
MSALDLILNVGKNCSKVLVTPELVIAESDVSSDLYPPED